MNSGASGPPETMRNQQKPKVVNGFCKIDVFTISDSLASIFV